MKYNKEFAKKKKKKKEVYRYNKNKLVQMQRIQHILLRKYSFM